MYKVWKRDKCRSQLLPVLRSGDRAGGAGKSTGKDTGTGTGKNTGTRSGACSITAPQYPAPVQAPVVSIENQNEELPVYKRKNKAAFFVGFIPVIVAIFKLMYAWLALVTIK